MAEASSPGIPGEIADAVRALARALESMPQVRGLKEAREEIGRHEAARIMLRDLRRREERLAEKNRRGEKPSPEEVEEFRRVAEVVGLNPYIRALWEAEVAFAGLMAAVMAALEAELGIPPALEEDRPAESCRGPESPAPGPAGPAGPAPPGSVRPVRTRLWVPGQP